MKECKVSLLSVSCSELPDGVCILLDNENLADGKMGQISTALQGVTTNNLDLYFLAHTANGQFGKRCKANSTILEAIKSELERRK